MFRARSCSSWTLLGSSLFFDRFHLVSLSFHMNFASLFLLIILMNSIEDGYICRPQICAHIIFFIFLFILFYSILILLDLKNKAHRPTLQAQGRGQPNETPRSLALIQKESPARLSQRMMTGVIGKAHGPQTKLNPFNMENRIIPNNVLFFESN